MPVGAARAGIFGSGIAIPDSAVQQNFATEQSFSNGQIVNPFADSIGSFGLSAVDDPEYQDAALNSGPAVVVDDGSSDGTEDGYEYDYSSNAVSEPLTIIWAFEVTDTVSMGTVFYESTDNRIYYRNDNNEWQLIIGGNSATAGTYSTGDKIVTLLIDDSDATLRINGGDTTFSVTSSAGLTLFDSLTSFFYDLDNSGRTLPMDAGGMVRHDTRLSGSDLTDEEQRVENEFGMSVL